MKCCPSCEGRGCVEAMDTGPTNLSVETWSANYPKTVTVDCENCKGEGEVFDIPARCKSDDGRIEIEFEAMDYFRQCTAKDVDALIECDWGGAYAADAVAEFFRETTTSRLFEYVSFLSEHHLSDHAGFECWIEGETAYDWLQANRPECLEEPPEEAPESEDEPLEWGETNDWGGNGDA